jgi:hypothetical protein
LLDTDGVKVDFDRNRLTERPSAEFSHLSPSLVGKVGRQQTRRTGLRAGRAFAQQAVAYEPQMDRRRCESIPSKYDRRSWCAVACSSRFRTSASSMRLEPKIDSRSRMLLSVVTRHCRDTRNDIE